MKRVLAMVLATGAIASAFFFGNVGLTFASHVSCGDTITQDTTLDSDLLNCPADGVVIGADNITLDLAGHTIAGLGLSAGIANRAGYDRVTIENGTVQGFSYAVQLGECDDPGACDSVRRNRVHGLALSGGVFVAGAEDNEIERNRLSRGGIGLWSSSGNRIRNNSISQASIYLYFADANQISSNEISKTEIRFYAANHNQVKHNSLAGSIESGAIVFEGGDENRIQENQITNADLGIAVVGGSANSNRINGNYVSNSGDRGILFVGSYNGIERNVVTGSAADGIEIYGSSNRVERNLATQNGDDGIDVHTAGTLLARNRANNNADLGIEAVPDVIDGGGNTAFGNGNPLQCLNVVCK